MSAKMGGPSVRWRRGSTSESPDGVVGDQSREVPSHETIPPLSPSRASRRPLTPTQHPIPPEVSHSRQKNFPPFSSTAYGHPTPAPLTPVCYPEIRKRL